MLSYNISESRHELVFTSKSRGVKREGNLPEAEGGSKKEAPSPKAAEPNEVFPQRRDMEMEDSPAQTAEPQIAEAATAGGSVATPAGQAAAQKAFSSEPTEATGKDDVTAEAATVAPHIPTDNSNNISGAFALGSGISPKLANGWPPAHQTASAPSSSSSEAAAEVEAGAETGHLTGISLEAAALLASLTGEGQAQLPSQPKPGLQGVHLDVSKPSTDDQPGWYCLVPMTEAGDALSKVSPPLLEEDSMHLRSYVLLSSCLKPACLSYAVIACHKQRLNMWHIITLMQMLVL